MGLEKLSQLGVYVVADLLGGAAAALASRPCRKRSNLCENQTPSSKFQNQRRAA